MAIDNRSVVITLRLDGDDSNLADTSNQTSTTKVSSKNDNDNTAKAVAAFAVKQAVEAAISEGIAWGEYYWNKEQNLTDDYIAQRNKRIATTQINRGISAVSSVGNAALAGFQIGGPVGAAIGAALGIAIQIASIARSNLQGQEQQDIMLKQMNAQLQFTRSRAGWSTEAASIGEDL